MKHNKQLGSFSLSDSLTLSNETNFLQRVIGSNTKKTICNPIKKFVPVGSETLEDLAHFFEPLPLHAQNEDPLDDLMDSFITKHGSSSFKTLDELLAASLSQTTYEPKSIKSLSDILDGFIEDLE